MKSFSMPYDDGATTLVFFCILHVALYTPALNGHADPTSALRTYTNRFVQLLCISASIHCENISARSLRTISKHLCTLLLASPSSNPLQSNRSAGEGDQDVGADRVADEAETTADNNQEQVQVCACCDNSVPNRFRVFLKIHNKCLRILDFVPDIVASHHSSL